MTEERDFAAHVSLKTDDELTAIWRSASDEDTENLSPMLAAVVEEMGRRKIPL